MMRRTALVLLVALGLVAGVSAQTTPGPTPPATLRLSLDEAVKMALDNNVDLSAARIDPQISDMRVAAAVGAFRPTFATGVNSNNQLLPPTSLLFPTATSNDVVTTNASLAQKLPWYGTTYSVSWSSTHTNSNSILNSYNPLLQSGLGASVSQPILRDLKIDAARQQVATTRTNRDIADTQLRESIVHTTAAVKSAYWNLVSARATVDARKSALDLAQELVRVNRAKVDVGTAPPLDLVSAQAEVASDQEQLIIAETTVKQAEDQVRLLILDPTKRETWRTAIDTADTPPVSTPTLDVEAAVDRALLERADLVRARKDIQNADTNVLYTGNQKLPDIRVNASYQASGLGGTQILRTGGFPGSIVGPGADIGFGNVLNQLFSRNYPTWGVGLSLSYPLGQSIEESNYARSRLERAQAEERLKGVESRAIQQIRNAAYQVEMNAKRIETTRAARDLAEQRLDSERKRLDVGMSTSFLVIQAQRDLAQARTNELSAVLSYDLSLVDFEALQQAGPATTQTAQSSQGSNGSQGGPGAPGAQGSGQVPAASAVLRNLTPTAIPGQTPQQ